MAYMDKYTKDDIRVKFLAFVIIMPAFIDVINVMLNAAGVGMTSFVTASIYLYVLLLLTLKCGIRKIDVVYLLGYYFVFLLNFTIFQETREEMLSIGMLIVYFFFIPYGIFAFKNITRWDRIFEYLYKYSKVAILLGGFMLLFLPYANYLGYMDYSYSILPAVCSVYYYYVKGQDKKSYTAIILFLIGIIEIAAFGARSGVFYAVLFVVILEILRDDISLKNKIIVGTMFLITSLLGIFFLEDILIFLSELPYFENSYLIRSFLKGKLYNTDTRQIIWDNCFERLNTMGLSITGFFGDRPYCGGAVYPHNIILEILMSWGWIIGSCTIIYLIYKIIKGLSCKNIERDICIFILLSCLSRFFMSGTYIREGKFWIAFFVLLALTRSKNSRRVFK